jgi:thiol-disulfide isomerase/thioredoxin
MGIKSFIFCILSLSLLLGCSKQDSHIYTEPQPVIVAGKVINPAPDLQKIRIAINRFGFSQESMSSDIDDSGQFVFKFDSYVPAEVWVIYKRNFLVLVRPGDSIYVEFDGSKNNRPEIINSIKFSGDATKMNQDAAAFLEMYFKRRVHSSIRNQARDKLSFDQYIHFEDSLRQDLLTVYNEFVNAYNPDEELKRWAYNHTENDYYYALARYPSFYNRKHNLNPNDFDIPITYYDFFKQRLPIEKSDLMGGYELSGFVNRFHYHYAFTNIRYEYLQNKEKTGVTIDTKSGLDSLYVYGLIKHTPDTLLRQMVLTEFFHQKLEKSDIDIFEEYQDVIEKYIQEPFLIKPLTEQYNDLKEKIENPVLASNTILNKLEGTSVNELVDTILEHNKGKVIYIDCWGTWCAPCLSEFPHSNELMKKLKNKKVAFVYLCIDSEEKNWKAQLSIHELGGQHYLLDKAQSSDLRNTFEISGVPFYVLIDKKGNIIEKGSHLRPRNKATINKIENLLSIN